ncbi:MAG: hypothetical protein H8M99_12385 [Gloeobacteraceae cyanobacterium ES-bin-144]|nr:hypothetical protein [Verrucomicrobiales bacterium]
MKSFHLLLLSIFFPAVVSADVLSELSPFLRNTNLNYDPTDFDPDVAVEGPVYAPFSPADSDLGFQQILGTYKGRPPVYVVFDTSLNYTDNAPGLTQASDNESWFSATRLAISWRPLIAYGWFADVGLSADVFRFEGNDAADFENFEPYVGVVKSIPELDDLLYYLRYDYQRITRGGLSDSSYSAQLIRTGFQKPIILTTTQQLTAGIETSFDITANKDDYEHNEYGVNLAYTYWFTDELNAAFSWNGSMWDFRDGGRRDWSQIVGIEFSWMPCQYARVFTNVYYTNHNSNVDSEVNDFQAWQTGLGFGITYSF